MARRHREAELERRQGHLRPKAGAQQAIDEAYGRSDRPDTVGQTSDLDRAPPALRAHERHQRASDPPRDSTCRSRYRPRDWPLRDFAAATRWSWSTTCCRFKARDHRRPRHPPVALGDGRGRDHRRSLPTSTRSRASGSAPTIRREEERRPLRVFSFDEMHASPRRPVERADGPRLHRHRHEARRGSAAAARGLRRRDLRVRRTAHEGVNPRGNQDRPRRAGRRTGRALSRRPSPG